MFCAYPRPRYQVSVYRTIGPLVLWNTDANQTKLLRLCLPLNMENVGTDSRIIISYEYAISAIPLRKILREVSVTS